jgi:isopenicillin N synthase-like dioxygenase
MMTFCQNSMQEQGFFYLDYPENLRLSVLRTIASWKQFCVLPYSEKSAFTFLEDRHGDGVGYEYKGEKGSKKDLKENFHVTLHQYERLAKIANNRTFPFLNDAKILLDHMEPLIMKFAEDMEREYNIVGLVKETLQAKPYWILRYLHYFGDQNEGAEIAAPHADKGGFTLHLYESDEGLEQFCLQTKSWRPMPVHEKQTVIIPAIQLQLLSKGTLKALYHRVVATERTARIGRFSMVCFIPFQTIPMYNKKSLGSMQTHPVGFNYSMAHEEFAKLFG